MKCLLSDRTDLGPNLVYNIMKIYQIGLALLFCVCVPCWGKALFANSVKDNEDGQERVEVVPNVNEENSNLYDSSSNYHENEDEGESIANKNIKFSKINSEKTQFNEAPVKRTREIEEMGSKLTYNKLKTRRSPFGIVYNQGKPIGILEPISQIYELQDFQSRNYLDDLGTKTGINKRYSGKEDIGELSSSIESENKRYMIGNNLQSSDNLKIKSIDQAEIAEHTNKKRNVEESGQSTTKSKRDVNESNLDEIEKNLKSIMNDLGLIKDGKVAKRESAFNEDEDLESGSNKIEMIKAFHSARNKKEDVPDESLKNAPHEDTSGANEDTKLKSKKGRSDLSNEAENFVRNKRQQKDNGDIVKGLESSGDLTVSGNKSPLASSESENKRKTPKVEKDEKPGNDEAEYEQRLQRNIQTKIKKIKEEVKREISNLKGNQTVGDKKKSDGNKEKRQEKKVRRKRTLEEMEAAAPQAGFGDKESLAPHVRSRRHINREQKYENEIRTKRNKVKEIDELQNEDLGFQNVQNQNVVEQASIQEKRAAANLERTAAIAANEELQKEANSPKQIEVELHEGEKDPNENISDNNKNNEKRSSQEDKMEAAKVFTLSDPRNLKEEPRINPGISKNNNLKDAELTEKNIKEEGISLEGASNEKEEDLENLHKSDQKRSEISPAPMEIANVEPSEKVIRSERKSEPNLSLEDMEILDSENNNKRKRRSSTDNEREKRQPLNIQLRTYRSEDDDVDDENDEFDDDNFDDRTASFIRKRAARNGAVYAGDYDSDSEINKRNVPARQYVADINSDGYENTNYLYEQNPMRKKRASNLFKNGAVISHLKAVKERNAVPAEKVDENQVQKQIKSQSIAGLSESDIFGGLPQSYEGELSRFKRVKRGEIKMKAM